jgi:TRAP-type C4-dicarboxylate transport system permease small subunit
MRFVFKKIVDGFDRFNTFLMVASLTLSVLLMLTVTIAVATRYFFDFAPTGWFELWQYTMLYITFLGAAWLLNKEGHVMMDVITSRLQARTQTILNIISSILGAICCGALAYWGTLQTRTSFINGYIELEAELNLPEWTIMWIIPFCSFLLFLQFIRRTYRFATGRMVKQAKLLG